MITLWRFLPTRLLWLVVAILCGVGTAAALWRMLHHREPSLGLRTLTALLSALAVETLRRALWAEPVPDSHGSAAFAPPPRAWQQPPVSDPLSPACDGRMFLGYDRKRAVYLPRSVALRHGLVLGPTGSGKSYGFFIPNARRLAGTSLVVTDPKSELWHKTARHHAEAHRFAPVDPHHSRVFNWIPLCQEARIAERIARAIVESGNTRRTEQVWLDLEAGFLSALFAHSATLEDPTPRTAYTLLTGQPGKALLGQLTDSASPIAREQANLLQETTERIRGSVLPVVAARLQFLRDPATVRFCSASPKPPDFGILRTRPTALYWCVPEGEITRLQALSAVFFTVLIEQLIAGQGKAAAESGRTACVQAAPRRGNCPVTLL